MQEGIFTIAENHALTGSIMRMKLLGDTEAIQRPGQFVNIRLPDRYLRRPLSVCDVDSMSFSVIYKTVCEGTYYMSTLQKGLRLDILTGLGNGFNLDRAGRNPLLIGGGTGVAPLYYLAKALHRRPAHVTALLGFQNADQAILIKEFEQLCDHVIVTTEDGSLGRRGVVTDVIPEEYSFFYTCGPEAMMEDVYGKTDTDGEFSFEARMGCGFGVCMGCTKRTLLGYKRICRDGPVLEKGELIW